MLVPRPQSLKVNIPTGFMRNGIHRRGISQRSKSSIIIGLGRPMRPNISCRVFRGQTTSWRALWRRGSELIAGKKLEAFEVDDLRVEG